MSLQCFSFTLLACILAAPAVRGTQPEKGGAGSDVERLIGESKFIFKGTVQRLNAATMSGVPVTDSTVVVRVDEILQAPQGFDHYAGKDITLQLSRPRSVQANERAFFFTTGAVYGKSIAVREVGRLADTAREANELRQKVAGAGQRRTDQEVQRRVASADLVVVGKVASVKAMEAATQPPGVTEHDPQWQEAIVTIESVEKGVFAEKTITVLFPASRDVMWYKAPKFAVGQEGIWILHKDRPREAGIKGFTALDPGDAQPKDQLERVKRLLQANR